MIYSDVIFNESAHTYTTPDGKSLSGITGMIDRQILGESTPIPLIIF
jgi:hypothetical protein